MPKKKRVADALSGAKKRSRTARSFYDDFAAKADRPEKLRENADGILEIVDHTGAVVARQLFPEKVQREAEERGITPAQRQAEILKQGSIENCKKLFRRQMGLPDDALVRTDNPKFLELYSKILKEGLYPYDELVAMDIAGRYASGERLRDFLGTAPYPTYRQFLRWKANNSSFREMMEVAVKERAERYIQELEHVADNVDALNHKPAKVRAEILKHLAAVSDPEKFGARTKLVGDKNQPIAFTVVSAIKDAEDIAAEQKALEDKA